MIILGDLYNQSVNTHQNQMQEKQETIDRLITVLTGLIPSIPGDCETVPCDYCSYCEYTNDLFERHCKAQNLGGPWSTMSTGSIGSPQWIRDCCIPGILKGDSEVPDDCKL